MISEILFTRKKGSKKSGTSIVSPETITEEDAVNLAEEVENAKRDSLTKEQTHMITTIIVKAVKKIKELTKNQAKQRFQKKYIFQDYGILFL